MSTIIAGNPAQLVFNVQRDGQPVAITGQVQARVFTLDGKAELITAREVPEDAPGADWMSGTVVVALTGEDTKDLQPGQAMLVLSGDFGLKRFRLTVETLFEPTRTSLFIKDLVVEELRRDRLMSAAAGVLNGITVSDDYLWDKIRAAESELSHTLRVPLVPTRFFPAKPTAEQLAALDGLPWEIEIGSDYTSDMFDGDRWGFIVTRQRPIVSIERLEFSYPVEGGSFFEIEPDWLNFDAKYGHIRIVPTNSASLMSFGGVFLTALAGGRLIPSMVRLTYTAGLTDVATKFPELLDAIKKTAVMKIVGDAFLPQSGSISGDGLSESISVDMGKYHADVDQIINGNDGSNGGLMTKIHGIRTMVL